MKAFGYLVAGAALLPGLANAQSQPAASSLPNGFRYKGCYTDLLFDSGSNVPATPANGLSAYPRALNGYVTTRSTNSASSCITTCVNLGRNYSVAATSDNQCWCDTALARNGTSSYGVTPSYGIQVGDSDCSLGCRNNTGEACGANNPNDANAHRLSVYQFVSGIS